MKISEIKDTSELLRLRAIYDENNAYLKVQIIDDRLAELAPEVAEERKDDKVLEAYMLKKSGATWKEVTEKTGIKAPWLSVGAYVKAEGLERV